MCTLKQVRKIYKCNKRKQKPTTNNNINRNLVLSKTKNKKGDQNRLQTIFEDPLAKNFLKPMKGTKKQIQEAR